MNTKHVLRAVIATAAVVFAAVASAIWLVPETAGRTVGIEAVRASGSAMLRSDFGGLFAGLAVLCGLAAWTQRRSWIIAVTTMLASIVCGRVIGWIANGQPGDDALAMAIELGLIACLVGYARSATATSTRAPAPRWRRLAVVTVTIGAIVAATAARAVPGVQQRLFAAGAQQVAATVNRMPLADDALRVAVCGSSAPLPSASRAKACVAVFAGGRFYLVDVGPESVENLVLWGIPLSAIDGVLLTHFHSDHIGDLGELNLQTWAGGRQRPLDVYGGPGVDEVTDGFSRAYRLDQGYRTAHHGSDVMPPGSWPMVPHVVNVNASANVDAAAEAGSTGRSAVVLDRDGLRITAFAVDHSPIAPAYAYRFDYRGRSAFVTGDLKFTPTLAAAARNVDLLLSEAIAVQMTRALGTGARAAGRANTAAVMHDIEDYHITPQEAARVANEANAGLLAFYHLLPAPDSGLARRVFAQGLSTIRRDNWTIADDGSLYTMPIGSQQVRIGVVAE